MLLCDPILRSEEIFTALDMYVKLKDLDWKKCVGICTDGARAMCGKRSSVVTRIQEINPDVSWTFIEKCWFQKVLKSVLDHSINIVNYIKTKPLQSRLFGKLCEEMKINKNNFYFTWKFVGCRGTRF